jgi:hypothetical protein
MQKNYWLLFFSLINFFTSLIIYLLFRSNVIEFIEFSENTVKPLKIIRQRLVSEKIFPPDYILFNLPDAMFLLAFNSLFIWLWFPQKSIFWIYTTLIILVTIEGLQYLKFISGTYDVCDLLSYVLATAISLIIYFFTFNKSINLKKPLN